MIVIPFKTSKITKGDNLFLLLDKYLPKLQEKDVVVVTSKIVSICQDRVIKNDGKITKQEIIEKEADLILPEKYVMYGVNLTITNNILIASAGVDESNSNGYFVLWPKNPANDAKRIWEYLKKKNRLKNLGVIICDSHGMILRRGLTGFGLSWCGFKPLKNYIGAPDVFGKELKVSKTNVVDSLATSAVLTMGEGNEQTPLAILSDVPFVEFLNRPPSQEEIDEMVIKMEDDIYKALLTSVKWERDKSK